MYDLAALASQVMKERGLVPEFSEEVSNQLQSITNPAPPLESSLDLRHLLWCSIDNDDSKDLDQLTFGQIIDNKSVIWVAVADVAGLVEKDTPIDRHAAVNTTSVYTPAKIFPMLPKKLSNDLTSLNENEDRAAVVIKLELNRNAEVETAEIIPAIVHNYAKLTYLKIGPWLEGKRAIPEEVQKIEGLAQALESQHAIAQMLEQKRHQLGALTLKNTNIEAKVEGKTIILEKSGDNAAHKLIENFMIAANQAMARRLRDLKIPSLRRVVRAPKKWSRIVEIAASFGHKLPSEPNARALDLFLIERKQLDPLSFPDLSLAIIKLLGRGEYIVENPGSSPVGHFGLALEQYTHSTAPNRRFPDLITQRMFLSYSRKQEPPYALFELESLALHCTTQEDAAMKVERHLNKSAAAVTLSSQIGKSFDGIVTGASEKGTWARTFNPPAEGKIVQGYKNLDVGDMIALKLLSVDIAKGYINFGFVSLMR